jgi:hypothetical protein
MNDPRAFEALYRGSAEPYDYSWRAVERLRWTWAAARDSLPFAWVPSPG